MSNKHFRPMAENPELIKLLERARSHAMTPEEKAEQRISFAYWNLAIDNDGVTKDDVRKVAEEIYGPYERIRANNMDQLNSKLERGE